MQKHFNQDKFLDTKQFPKAKFTGKITNFNDIKWDADGTYDASIRGDLTIKGVSKSYSETGSITVSGSTIEAKSTFNVTLSDHGIAFQDGKPSTNIAKTVEITLIAEYQPQYIIYSI